MTVTLTPDVETRLRSYAKELDLDPEQLSNAFLARDLEEAEAELKETMEGLDRSMADIAAGRWLTSEQFDRRMEARVAAARECTGTGSAGLLLNESPCGTKCRA